MLQNRYGDTEFPIRNRRGNARITRAALLRARPGRASARNLVWMAPAIVLLAVVFIVTDGFDRVPGGDLGGLVTMGALVGFVLLVAGGLSAATLVDARRPKADQQRYWAATGARPLSDREQQLLALDAQSDFSFGGWNSSLDYGPAWSRMPEEAQTRHRREPRHQPFLTMPLLETDALRARLDADHHIASGSDLELFVADALTDRSLTLRFASVLAGEQGERMLARVSSLTGVDQWGLRALVESDRDRPPVGLWGADSQRVISVVRMGFLAGYADEAAAWALVERAAAPAAALFDGWDAYWANVRIGLAFMSDRLDAVQAFDRSLDALRASAWPAARAAFPRSPVPEWLPRVAPPGSDSVSDRPYGA